MAVKMEFGSSISCLSAYLSSPCQRKAKLKMTSRLGLFDSAEHLRYLGGVKSCKLTYRKLTANKIFSKRQHIFRVVPQDHESFGEIELDDFEDEQQQPSVEYASTADISNHHIERAEGKPGFISFHGLTNRSKDQILVYSLEKNNNHLLWFISPTILVASFIFPSLYLRRLLSTVFEDSLLTDFLILFFTEALFYCGVAIFLFLLDRLWRPMDPLSTVTNRELPPHMGHRISSVTILALSLIIPMVTMGFVWPWTGPAASATLAPCLVGIVIQYAFEQYAKYISSPSWPAIPVIFQVYRLHQLNRAAKLVTVLSFTVRGAEMTSHNMSMNGSLNTLLNVLHILGMLCIWSLSSFIMRYFLSASTPEQQNMREARFHPN